MSSFWEKGKNHLKNPQIKAFTKKLEFQKSLIMLVLQKFVLEIAFPKIDNFQVLANNLQNR